MKSYTENKLKEVNVGSKIFSLIVDEAREN